MFLQKRAGMGVVRLLEGIFELSFFETRDRLWTELESIASEEGVVLYDLERFGAGALRIFITGVNKDTPVKSGDCSRLCRRLMTYFMVEGPSFGLSTEPELEVSSPGVNRHLRLPKHFAGAVGERVKFGVRGSLTSTEGEERKDVGFLLGTLEGVESDVILVREEKTEQAWKFGISQVTRANVEFQFR